MRALWLAVPLLLLAGCKSAPVDPMAAGGVRVVLQVDSSTWDAYELARPDMTMSRYVSRVKRSLVAKEQRVIVRAIGGDKLEVDFPGLSNVAWAHKLLSPSGGIALYHAINVGTERWPGRPYRDVPPPDPDDPVVWFTSVAQDAVIQPTDPKYSKIIAGWGKPILAGDDVEVAELRMEGKGNFVPTMHFSASGAAKMKKWSHLYYNSGEKLAWVLDNKVINVAPIAPGALIDADVYIGGAFSAKYVVKLRDMINAGALPRNLKEVSADVVKAK